MGFVDQLSCVELVEAHKPVGLVETMFTVKLHAGIWQAFVGVHGQVRTEEHALQRKRAVQSAGKGEYLIVRFGCGTDNHLRRLPGRGKCAGFACNGRLRVVGGVLAHKGTGVAVFGDRSFYLPHGRNDVLLRLVGCQKRQAFAGWKFHVHA